MITLDVLKICVGARVMLIKNTNQAIGLVNGATGVVTGFKEVSMSAFENNPNGLVPIVLFDSGMEVTLEAEKWDIMEGTEVKAFHRQIPLILAWALSVHKCQGLTLDRLTTDLTRAFGSGMVYAALSRVTTIHNVFLCN
ncbi:hypothetical protein ZOSMA_164G00290 [Zostera marina]|uniref:DNA helicase Pif1-like 2B domain-containing protein n=1 Tax=Zostera marina TaxID=29655 RepID=A0A0K9PW06_ZOSMR|nr:hypothetical protein ZOSMA_164G00290 [Zostera marina]